MKMLHKYLLMISDIENSIAISRTQLKWRAFENFLFGKLFFGQLQKIIFSFDFFFLLEGGGGRGVSIRNFFFE